MSRKNQPIGTVVDADGVEREVYQNAKGNFYVVVDGRCHYGITADMLKQFTTKEDEMNKSYTEIESRLDFDLITRIGNEIYGENIKLGQTYLITSPIVSVNNPAQMGDIYAGSWYWAHIILRTNEIMFNRKSASDGHTVIMDLNSFFKNDNKEEEKVTTTSPTRTNEFKFAHYEWVDGKKIVVHYHRTADELAQCMGKTIDRSKYSTAPKAVGPRVVTREGIKVMFCNGMTRVEAMAQMVTLREHGAKIISLKTGKDGKTPIIAYVVPDDAQIQQEADERAAEYLDGELSENWEI